MKRWHEDYNKTFREWKRHRRIHIESNKNSSAYHGIGRDPYEVDCECDNQKGRFRKMDAFDCGNTKCRYCHYSKFLGARDITYQEECADMKMKEGIADL